MATTAAQPIVFIVPGQEQPTRTRGAAPAPLPAGLTNGVLKQSVRVGAQRGASGQVRVTAVPGEDVVVLHIAGGPALTLHPENARDLMLAQQGEIKRTRGARGVDQPGPNEIQVPAQLQWRGLEQGARHPRCRARLPGRRVAVGDRGHHRSRQGQGGRFCRGGGGATRRRASRPLASMRLHASRYPSSRAAGTPLAQAPAAPDGGPLLVFVHGTFSKTSGTVRQAVDAASAACARAVHQYGGRVYALDHPTLGASPIANALTLAQALARRARACTGDAFARRAGGRGAGARLREPGR